LFFQEKEVVTFTWVAPWARSVLESGFVQYVELDASFYAIRPYAYIIPFAIIANYGIPLGLAVAPSEREEAYRLFDESLKRIGLGAGLVELTPVLSDQGKALIAYCKGYEFRHFFCFRHFLELLGSGTYVAMLARRLLFTGSEGEYRQLKAITIVDFQIGCREGAITSKGARHFCELFGLSLSEENQVTVNDSDPFLTQALWSHRGSLGVATCTNHSEGFHGRANRKVAGVRCLIRRIAIVIDMLNNKHDHFSLSKINRSAKVMLSALSESAKMDQREPIDTTRCPENCGWDHIYARRFMIPNFPCRHTVSNPSLDIDWDRSESNFRLSEPESTHEVHVSAYTGRDWMLTRLKGRKVGFPVEEPTGSPPVGDAATFIERLHAELAVAFPHAKGMSKIMISIEFGRFLKSNSPDNLEIRARFQLRLFRQYSTG
jgi:hypothetical protein